MRRPFPIRSAVVLAVGCALTATPAAAQSWGHDRGHDPYRGGSNWAPSAFDWRSQLDRPGDYRCDAFWDASRTDCDARWRDQRHRVSPQARRDYRALAGYGHNDGWYGRSHGYGYGYGYGYGHGYGRYGGYSTWRDYGRGHGHGYGHGQSAGTAYHGAYGRPDLVYPGGHGGHGHTGYADGRDHGRIDWCRTRYRSYDPASGYYRAWSGRLIFCG